MKLREPSIDRVGTSAHISYQPAFEQGSPIRVLLFLNLGNGYHVSKCVILTNLHFTAPLNISYRCPRPAQPIYMTKGSLQKTVPSLTLALTFQEAIGFTECQGKEGKALVHRETGLPNSPTICKVNLTKTKQFRLKEALSPIRKRRSDRLLFGLQPAPALWL